MYERPINRRRWLNQAASVAAGASLVGWPFERHAAQADEAQVTPAVEASLRGTAQGCILLWLGGGACHIDTFDPKRRSTDRRSPGSYYDAIPSAVSGVQVCEHLDRTARLLDRCVLIRSLHHNVVDEHAAATHRLHTGRPPADTTVYPAVGAVVAYELGAADNRVPAYVVAGYPSASRGPGFLGAQYGYVYLTDTELGPTGLRRPLGLSESRQHRRDQLLATMRTRFAAQNPDDSLIQDYVSAAEAGSRLTGSKFMRVFDLQQEPASLRERYGGEFGQRCLLGRRLVEAGVRFVEVSFNLNFINGTGWDTHNEGQLQQHRLIQQLDQAFSALVGDLEQRGMLETTLVVIATEFGRPPEFDGGGGRGHQSDAFSAVLAGGGLKTGQVIGATDDVGRTIVSRPVSIPDFHATIYTAMGIDPGTELYDGDRPVPITDYGRPIRELFV